MLEGRRRESLSGGAKVRHDAAAAERALRRGLEALELSESQLVELPKGAAEKVALAGLGVVGEATNDGAATLGERAAAYGALQSRGPSGEPYAPAARTPLGKGAEQVDASPG